MDELSLSAVVLLSLAALVAGWIDAVVGGGGLVLLPALLIGLPQLPPAFALGTNKVAAVAGTSMAAVTYARRTPLNTRLAARLAGLAMVSAGVGAYFAASVEKEVLNPVIMVVLLGVAGFVVFRPRFGTVAGTGPVTVRRSLAALLVAGGVIALYDGLIGPGTGTFLVIALVGLLHMDMVTASATAKIVNVGTNIGALAVFTAHGTVLWALAPLLALFNLAGGWIGAHMALKKGNGFVRAVLLTVVAVLVAKLGYDQWGG